MNRKFRNKLYDILFTAAIILVASTLIGLGVAVLLFQNTEVSTVAGFWVGGFCAIISLVAILKKFCFQRMSVKPVIHAIAEERRHRINREANKRRYEEFKARQKQAERKPYYETNW